MVSTYCAAIAIVHGAHKFCFSGQSQNLFTESAPPQHPLRPVMCGTLKRINRSMPFTLEQKWRTMVDLADLKIDCLCAESTRVFANLEVKCNEALQHIISTFFLVRARYTTW